VALQQDDDRALIKGWKGRSVRLAEQGLREGGTKGGGQRVEVAVGAACQAGTACERAEQMPVHSNGADGGILAYSPHTCIRPTQQQPHTSSCGT
jgi:hypothetical protein